MLELPVLIWSGTFFFFFYLKLLSIFTLVLPTYTKENISDILVCDSII